jgi:MFS family permease
MDRGWLELVRGGNAPRSAVVGGGMVMHAINVFIVTTILPSVVREIGGLRYFAWNTTLYVVASLIGGALLPRLLGRIPPRGGYRLALGVFALGTALCALAPSMPALLAGRLVQGLGAGLLSALSFTMIRLMFTEPLWPRALSVVSAMWGVATLLGPAVGGVFAQYDAWRAAFWTLLAITPLFALLVEMALPRDLPEVAAPRTRMAFGNLALLAGGVLAISAGSMASGWQGNLLGLAVSAAALAVFVRREAAGGNRLLPHGACHPATPLGATYAAMAMLLVGITSEIFVPYFLQTLHGMRPLYAGYLSALLTMGWTIGSVGVSGLSAPAARVSTAAGPTALVVGLAALAVLMPGQTPAPGLPIALIGAALLTMGLGIGLCWPHLGARVFSFAREGEKDLAAASMTIVVMVANAFGSALGGMVTNLAGLTNPGGAVGASVAASWLFGGFMMAPALAGLAIRRLLAIQSAAPAIQEA